MAGGVATSADAAGAVVDVGSGIFVVVFKVNISMVQNTRTQPDGGSWISAQTVGAKLLMVKSYKNAVVTSAVLNATLEATVLGGSEVDAPVNQNRPQQPLTLIKWSLHLLYQLSNQALSQSRRIPCHLHRTLDPLHAK